MKRKYRTAEQIVNKLKRADAVIASGGTCQAQAAGFKAQSVAFNVRSPTGDDVPPCKRGSHYLLFVSSTKSPEPRMQNTLPLAF